MAGFADIHQSAVSATQFPAEDGITPLLWELSSGSASTCIEPQRLSSINSCDDRFLAAIACRYGRNLHENLVDAAWDREPWISFLAKLMQALWWTWQAIGVMINVSVYWMRFKAWFSDGQISIVQKVLEDYLVNGSERAHCLSLQMLIFKVSGPITDTSNSTYTSNGIANCLIWLAIVIHGDCRFECVIRGESEDSSKFSLNDHIDSSESRVLSLF